MSVLVIVTKAVPNRTFISIANGRGRKRGLFHLLLHLIHWGIIARKVSLFLHELVLCLVNHLAPELVAIRHGSAVGLDWSIVVSGSFLLLIDLHRLVLVMSRLRRVLRPNRIVQAHRVVVS